ncbi:FAD-binding oxidoreductase [Dongia soli]|uniref:D-lactate dehydrogenase (cytochrome) n=1 Tax=Dongia soli TaxID=600628 RepID=A0ABU5E4U3_9PROT|nr:FAD-linked oxidase C-terminal domain-containing protein [Dongia soli]MDY0881266.1 FAD-linked oxidase C-terminal domain-containing protein [Dongia soli]
MAQEARRLADPTALIAALTALLGDNRVSTNPGILDRHGHDESYHPTHAPDVVVFPQSTEEVAQVMRLARRHAAPVIPFGVGTSLEGHVAALQGGVSVDLSGMNQIIEVNGDDLDVQVQAGVTRKQLNAHLRDAGLFFPIDPGADATIGGMTSTRASGTNAVRYGTMRENVLGLTVVLADGRVIKTGGRARKSAAGYDLTRLFVGSEGTLGVITEIRLRLYGIPEAIAAAVAPFPTIGEAVNTVIRIIQSGIPVARIELLDEVQMDAVNRYSQLDYPVAPTLFFEFHGSEAGVTEQSDAVKMIASDFGGTDFRWSTRAEERNKLWQARHDAYYAGINLRPGAKGWPTDVCVPISRLADCIVATKADIAASGLLAPIVGHVGDGNFHTNMIIDPANPAELAAAEAFNQRLVARALEMGGTCTGEHGIGYGKIAFLEQEHGAEAVQLMRLLKQSIDPDNRLNPGKIFRN